MHLGMVGLDRMGGNIVRRFMQSRHAAVVYARRPEATRGVADEGAAGALSLEDPVAGLEAPRVVRVMLPAGEITETTIWQLASLLDEGHPIIDDGNTFWQDDMRRAGELERRDPRAGQGYIHAGPDWAGHSVKMIHNGIEYGLMQACAEGFDTLRNASSPPLPLEHRFELDCTATVLAEKILSAMRKGFGGHIEAKQPKGACS